MEDWDKDRETMEEEGVEEEEEAEEEKVEGVLLYLIQLY